MNTEFNISPSIVFSVQAPMCVELTMAAAAVCASPFRTAGPVAALTIKSWMSIMSPAKVLSSFTRS